LCWTGRNDVAVVLIWILLVTGGAAESAVIAPSPDGAGGRPLQTPAAPSTATAPASPYKERLLEVDINRSNCVKPFWSSKTKPVRCTY
jgi:hypothetical protein